MSENGAGLSAMILAAGLGTRLRPLTDHLPKPLVPVLGRPLLDTIVLNLRAAGVGRFGLNTHHLAGKMAEHVASLPGAGDFALFHEPDILGTGGALAGAREFLEQDDLFLLHNGDVLTDLDLAALVAAHRRGGAVATIALVDWEPANKVLCRFGTGDDPPAVSAAPGACEVQLEGDAEEGDVLDIDERLDVEISSGCRLLTYTGVAILSREILRLLPAGPSSLIDALLKALSSRRGAVRGWAPRALYWNDLGSLERFLDAHRHILIERRLALPDLAMPGGAVHLGSLARVAPGARLAGFVSVGAGSVVEDGAELEDCVVLSGVRVLAGTRQRRAVLGDGWTAVEPLAQPASLACVRVAGFGAHVLAEPITGHGSDRTFVRLRDEGDGGREAVLMLAGADDPEFDRYVAIGRFLHAERLGGPAILAVDSALRAVVMEDLGDESLYGLVLRQRNVAATGFPTGARPAGDEWPAPALPDIDDHYRRVLDLLVDLQTRGTAAMSRCPPACDRLFDHQTLRWETDYFRRRFLREWCGLPSDALAALDGEFEQLARAVLAQPVVLMHRDFQSQNVLIRDHAVRLVDFQGMRRGPFAYDLMSLLRDPYVEIGAPRRAELMAYYRQRLAARGGPQLAPHELRAQAITAGLQRNMQALGAYAYLTLVKGKAAFQQHIPAGLRHLREGLHDLRESGAPPGSLPRLEEIVHRLPLAGR